MEREATQNRYEGIDTLRFVAAVAIIWLHTVAISSRYAHLADAARFAVPYFAVTAIVLLGRRRREGGTYLSFAKSRLMRIYLPFVLWTVFYIILRDAKHVLRPSNPVVELKPSLLLIGSAHHLWFLPFIMVASLAAMPAAGALVRQGASALWTVALVGLGVAVALVPFHPSEAELGQAWSYLLELGWNALPGAIWGLALAPHFGRLAEELRGRWKLSLGLAGLVAALMVVVVMRGRNIALENMAGVLLLMVALSLPEVRWLRGVSVAGRLAYSIYLIHVAVILGLEMFMVHDRETVPLRVLVVTFVLASVGSLVAAWLASKARWLWWAMPT